MPSWTYRGDINRALEWYAIAVTELKSMIAIGTPVMTLNPVEGVTIMLQSSPPHIHIIAGAGDIYLESGFYDLRSTAICAENTFRPAFLHYNQPIQNYINSVSLPLQGLVTSALEGEKLDDGFLSLSVGCEEKLNRVTDPCGTEYIAAQAFCSPQQITQQKIAQNRVPSSMFSGKMRLFVQAIYGSRRTDYKIKTGLNGLPSQGDYDLYLTDQGDDAIDFKLEWGFPYTMGIVNTPDYKYYLISIRPDAIFLYPLRLSAAATAFIKELKLADSLPDTPEIKTRLEAYVLSTAKIKIEDKLTVDFEPESDTIASGYPLAYGWKFNNSGMEASIIIMTDATEFGTRELFDAEEFKLELNYDEELEEFKPVLSSMSSGQWRHDLNFVAWVPDWFQYSQLQYGVHTSAREFSTSDCPLYGWYEGEVFKKISMDINISSSTETRNDPPIEITPGCGDQETERLVYSKNGLVGDVIFSGMADVTGKVNHTDNEIVYTYFYNVDEYLSGMATEQSGSGATDFNSGLCIGGNVLSWLKTNGHWTQSPSSSSMIITDSDATYDYGVSAQIYDKQFLYNRDSKDDLIELCKLGIIIPMLDAESLSTLLRQTDTMLSKSIITHGRHSNAITKSRVDFVKIRVERATGNKSVVEVIDSEPISRFATFAFSSPGTSSSSPDIDEAKAEINIKSNDAGESALEEDGFEIRSTTGVAADITWIEPYTSGIFGLPLGGNTIITKSSSEGATITYHGELTGENLNGFRNKSAVGWA